MVLKDLLILKSMICADGMDGLQSPILKFLSEEAVQAILTVLKQKQAMLFSLVRIKLIS